MKAHQIRNNKTSLIFTLAVSFLLYSASYFSLMAVLIEKAFGKMIGADVLVFGWYEILD